MHDPRAVRDPETGLPVMFPRETYRPPVGAQEENRPADRAVWVVTVIGLALLLLTEDWARKFLLGLFS